MANNFLLPCSSVRKTGTIQAQGAGPTLQQAIANAITVGLARVSFFPPSFPRCDLRCPIGHVHPPVAEGFTSDDSGEFDTPLPGGGSLHHFYVIGVLNWSMTRTCSKLHLANIKGLSKKLLGRTAAGSKVVRRSKGRR